MLSQEPAREGGVIETPQGTSLLFLEIDRNTEPGQRFSDSENQRDFRKKLLVYQELNRRKDEKDILNGSAFRVLTAVPTMERREQLKKLARELDYVEGKHGAPYFLFVLQENVRPTDPLHLFYNPVCHTPSRKDWRLYKPPPPEQHQEPHPVNMVLPEEHSFEGRHTP